MAELEIAEVGGGGWGIARRDGEVWLVGGALPGELVRAEAARRRAGIVEARTVEVLQASPWRAQSPCPLLGSCGGCDMGHVAEAGRGEMVRAVVRGALRHAPAELAARLATARLERGNGEGYRLRVRLHWDAATGALGFRAVRSHRVVRIHPCRVVSARLRETMGELEQALGTARCGGGEVEWLESLNSSQAVLGLRLAEGGMLRCRGVEGAWRVSAGGRGAGWGATGVRMALPLPLFVPVGAFFQAHRELVPRLFQRVAELVRQSAPREVVDLYGGVGFLAAAARLGGAPGLTVVEANPDAARAARSNLPGAQVVAASCEEFLGRHTIPAHALAIVDPPRAGMSRLARERLLAHRPQQVVLLSCDAARFGRDAAALLTGGYELNELELWDMFPGTHHVEILAVFQRGT